MDHVRVGEDHVRPLADLPPLLGRSVAVVDGGLEPGNAQRGQRAELVLGERLRRVEVESAALRVAGQLVEHREIEGERLPRRSAGRHEHVRSARAASHTCPLVGVEPGTPTASRDARVELVRQRRGRASRAGSVTRCASSSPASSPSQRSTSTAQRRSDASLGDRGALIGAEITPVEPDPVRTGEGSCSDGSESIDDRRVGQRRRRRDPGRPEGVRRRGRARNVGDRRADRPEHDRRHRRARGAGGVRRRTARGGLLGYRRRRGEDRDALLSRGDRGGGRVPRRPSVPLVVDPVLVASSGAKLLEDDAVAALVALLFPLATVVTPNLPEARALAGDGDARRARRAARRARRAGRRSSRAATATTRSIISSTGASISRSRSSGSMSRRRTAPAALIPRRSPRCSPAGCRSPMRRTAAARVATDAVRNGLAELGAGDGPVDVLNVKGMHADG